MKLCWVPIALDKTGKYLAEPGGAYAGLLSVDSRASIGDVADNLTKKGFQVIYSWKSGQPSRGQYWVDNWLQNLSPPAAGNVWMYFELRYTGSEILSLATHFEKCILMICGGADIIYVFAAQQVADNYHPCGPGDPNQGNCPPLPPPPPGCPPKPSPWKPALIGAGVATGALITVHALRGGFG